MSKSNVAVSSMLPCAYSHFFAKAQTLTLKTEELLEGMLAEGADEAVLQAISSAITVVQAAQDTISFAKTLREGQMAADRDAKRAAREAEAAIRKAQAAAKKASAASTVEVPSTLPVIEGPEGPSTTTV